MPRSLTITYLVTLAVLAVLGFVIDAPFWVEALIGVAAMTPIAIGSALVARRRRHETQQ